MKGFSRRSSERPNDSFGDYFRENSHHFSHLEAKMTLLVTDQGKRVTISVTGTYQKRCNIVKGCLNLRQPMFLTDYDIFITLRRQVLLQEVNTSSRS